METTKKVLEAFNPAHRPVVIIDGTEYPMREVIYEHWVPSKDSWRSERLIGYSAAIEANGISQVASGILATKEAAREWFTWGML